MGIETVIAILTPRISVCAKNIEVDHSVFAMDFVRIYFRGDPKSFEQIDNLLRSLKFYIEKYFINYDFQMKMVFREGG